MDAASIARLFLLAAIWGGSFLFMRIGVPVFGPVGLIALRVSIAALFLWVASRYLKHRLEFDRHWKEYLILGLLNSALPFTLFAYAAQSLSASLLSIVNATAALWGALISALWLRTPITRSVALGLACGFAGVVLLVGNGIALAGEHGGSGWGPMTAGLVAPLSYALASTYAKLRQSAASAFAKAHGSTWMASLLMLPLLAFFPFHVTPLAGDWLAASTLGIVCTGAAFLLYFRLIADVGPTRALSVAFLIPLFGIIWGVVFLDETIGWDTVSGGLLVLAGIALSNGLVKWPAARV